MTNSTDILADAIHAAECGCDGAVWRSTSGGYHHDWWVEDVLTAGGTVLRRGYGDEHSKDA